MKFSLTTPLVCTMSDAWDALHNPDVFREVSAPLLAFRAVSPEVFPLRYESGKRYVVRAFALGLLPLGTQEINPLTDLGADERVFRDNGRGLSGALGLVSLFRHTMTLRPSGTGPTLLHDELEFRAGVLTPLLWIGFRVFWAWRHARIRRLAPTWHGATTQAWESRYRDTRVWSGEVNPTLPSITQDLAPGQALELGCGEGADALWLAERGWRVTAVDASPSALMRGEEERKARVRKDATPREVRWIAQDCVVDDLPRHPGGYDLVTAHFLHMPPGDRAVVWKKLVSQVAPGGTLVIVGHSPSDAASGARRPPAEMTFDAKELRALVPSSWSSVNVSTIRRSQPGPDGSALNVADIVLVATR